MTAINKDHFASFLLQNTSIRFVESNIYSVFPDNKFDYPYDTLFGSVYDWIACNPIYNRLIWGYSVKMFPKIANEALHSERAGKFLDLGCGSLTFTAQIYVQPSERPVVLVDQSLNMLRKGKSRLIKRNGKVPDHLVFLQADALHLPFQEKAFKTILLQNLLHCLENTSTLLERLKKIISEDGKMYFTTLVKNGRYADRYLQALADRGKLVSRTDRDHKELFAHAGLPARFETHGSILAVYC